MKKFAPLAALFGLLAALLFGSASAQAVTPNNAGTFQCSNGINVGTVNCNDVLDNVTVVITGNRVLTGDELNILSGDLNNVKLNISDIQVLVVNVYKSFNPPINITVKDVNVCIASLCG